VYLEGVAGNDGEGEGSVLTVSFWCGCGHLGSLRFADFCACVVVLRELIQRVGNFEVALSRSIS